MPWNLVVRWGIDTKWQSLIQLRQRWGQWGGGVGGHVSVPRSGSSSLSAMLQSFPPLLVQLNSPSQRETEHIWSRSHGAKHGASPAPSQHHKHTQKHIHTHMSWNAAVWWHWIVCLSLVICANRRPNSISCIFSLMRKAIFIRFNKAGKELYYFKKKKKSFQLKCSLKAS